MTGINDLPRGRTTPNSFPYSLSLTSDSFIPLLLLMHLFISFLILTSIVSFVHSWVLFLCPWSAYPFICSLLFSPCSISLLFPYCHPYCSLFSHFPSSLCLTSDAPRFLFSKLKNHQNLSDLEVIQCVLKTRLLHFLSKQALRELDSLHISPPMFLHLFYGRHLGINSLPISHITPDPITCILHHGEQVNFICYTQ